MVGGDRVSKDPHRPGTCDICDRPGLHAKSEEEWRFLDVCARRVPLVNLSGRRWHLVPFRILIGKTSVELLKNLGLERRLHGFADFLETRPDVLEIDINPILVLRDWFLREVDIHAAREGECHNERRRHQEIRPDILVNAGLEIPVAGENSRRHEVILDNGRFDFGVERTGIADAGCAPVADDLESELVEILLQPGFFQVVLHHARTRGERGLHGRIHMKPAQNRFFRKQPGSEHHAGIAGVRAACDGGDEHRSVAEHTVLLVKRRLRKILHLVRSRTVGDHLRFVFGKHAVDFDACAAPEIRGGFSVAPLRDSFGQKIREGGLEIGEINPVLGTFRAGHAGLDGGEVEVDVHAIRDVAFAGHPEQILCAEIILECPALSIRAARRREVVHRLGIDREKSHRRPVFGGHVGDCRAVGERETRRSFAVKFHKFSNDLCRAEKLGHMQGEIRRRHSLAKAVREMDADNFRCQKIHRLPEHARLGLNATDSPTDNSQPVDHRRVGIRADKRIGVVNRRTTRRIDG